MFKLEVFHGHEFQNMQECFGADMALLWLLCHFFSRAYLGHPVLPLRFIINNCNAFFFGECWGFTFIFHYCNPTGKNDDVNHPNICKIEALLHYCNPTKDQQHINKRQKKQQLWLMTNGPTIQNWVVVSNIFYFHPLFEEDSHFDSYFSNGLKPPTRKPWRIEILKQKILQIEKPISKPTIQKIEALVFGFD